MTNTEHNSLKREVIWVFAVTLLVTGGLALMQMSVGWIRGYVLLIAAMVFMYLPLEVLHRKGIDPESFGIHRNEPWRALKNALLVSLIVFPIYSIGFHVWQTQWLQKDLAPEAMRLDQWPVDIQDPPRVRAIPEGEVQTYTYGDEFRIRWRLPAGQRFEALVSSDEPITPTIGRPRFEGDSTAIYQGGSHGRVGFMIPGNRVSMEVQAGGDRLPAKRLKTGTTLSSADRNPYETERSYWWIINLVLLQFLLVALPEELFYRGYLQTRLDQLFSGSEREIFGVSVNVKSIVITSALFAIGHIITIPAPSRLAVFFPSLLFGWMRRATGGILAPLIFHAFCNLFVEFAGLAYS